VIAFKFALLSGSFGVPNPTKGLFWYLAAWPPYHFAWSARACPDKVFGLPPLDE